MRPSPSSDLTGAWTSVTEATTSVCSAVALAGSAPGLVVALGGSQPDPAAAVESARTSVRWFDNQIAQGSKIVFQVAGGCGLGALQAAKQKGVYGIGVDADQGYLGSYILTSALKHVDVAVIAATLWLLAAWAVLAMITLVYDFNVGLPITVGLCAIGAYVLGSNAAIRLIKSLKA